MVKEFGLKMNINNDAFLVKKFEDRIANAPPHTGHSKLGLEKAIKHLDEVKDDLLITFNDGKISKDDYASLFTKISSDRYELLTRLNKIVSVKNNKSKELMNLLGIPMYANGLIKATELYDILMNDDNVSEIVSKLKMKAFW